MNANDPIACCGELGDDDPGAHLVRTNGTRRVMIKTIGALIALVTILGGAGGCQTMTTVLQAKERGEGTAKVYPVSESQAWDISRAVFRWEGCDAIEEHRSEGYMLTSSGMNFVSYGSVMGAWIEPASYGSSNVTVITKRRVATNLFTTLTETTYHNRFAEAVELVKSGQPLPAQRPYQGEPMGE